MDYFEKIQFGLLNSAYQPMPSGFVFYRYCNISKFYIPYYLIKHFNISKQLFELFWLYFYLFLFLASKVNEKSFALFKFISCLDLTFKVLF